MSAMLNELVVMNDVAKILQPLKKDECRRVIDWLADYLDVYDDFDFGDATFVEVSGEPDEEYVEVEEALPVDEGFVADTFKALYERVNPKTAIQKIVTSAYWLENTESQETWTSFQTNKLLKSLGVKISSVSGTLAIEGKKELPLIVVLEKSGDSMQSRKTFKLSAAGIDYVESRLN